ncbi:hypothetical protein LZD49_31080 [Dyadobacter sp. CY261]|uniref:hypothetical protein n=1 Tax=Dyadobacter sp. CY261 TaxID=2907203 RepID=UPI001F2CD5EE|nr:hypothetical protein [Dyadobacter sp. CY261]MCF0074969.1 hypothetical protein [Dyadobacter sp. CY261]
MKRQFFRIKKMLKFILISFAMAVLGTTFSFSQEQENPEILRMYNEDQSARKASNINWTRLNKEDSLRRSRTSQLLDAGKVVTAQDYYRSAMIFQHGSDTIASSTAIRLMKTAIELDSTVNRWLLAAAIDRHLMRKGLPQTYGTQYIMIGQTGKWQRYQIDTTKVTDQERKAYNVETLAEQTEKERRMNLHPISQYHAINKSTEKTIALIVDEAKKGKASQYDVSEAAVNAFGYQLINTPEEALKIFKLNTELHPNAFNTFDSYGECLLKLGRREEAVSAYGKSLLLNPKNTSAKSVLSKLQAN